MLRRYDNIEYYGKSFELCLQFCVHHLVGVSGPPNACDQDFLIPFEEIVPGDLETVGRAG